MASILPPAGGSPMGAGGPPPEMGAGMPGKGGGEGPTLGDLLGILMQLPPQIKSLIVDQLTKAESEGVMQPPPEGAPAEGGPAPEGGAGLKEAAAARAMAKMKQGV